MESSIEINTKVTLVLNEEEAEWLKGTVQNPPGCTPEQEDPYNQKMRLKLWETLNRRN